MRRETKIIVSSRSRHLHVIYPRGGSSNLSRFHYLSLVRPHLEELNELLGVLVLHGRYVQIPKMICLGLKSVLLQLSAVLLKNINSVSRLFG